MGANAFSPAAQLPGDQFNPASPYFTVPRSAMSRSELAIEWHYPVFTGEVKDVGGNTIAREKKRALPLEQVFSLLAEDDPRPLLVLRECLTCTGTDDALLTRQTDNEKTMLMSRWFRCVKLPPAVIEDDHPFHKLFEGDEPSHLFVARANGSDRIDLNGSQSRTELWKVMGAHLTSHYSDKPDKAVKHLVRILDEYDDLERRLTELNTKLDRVIEEDGPDSKKAKKLFKEREGLLADRNDARARAERVSLLEPRKEPKKI